MTFVGFRVDLCDLLWVEWRKIMLSEERHVGKSLGIDVGAHVQLF